MFLISIFQWWYTIGWAQRWRGILTNSRKLVESFSLGIILKTLFKPWKQITTLERDSNFIHRALDSLVSRMVGFFARIFVLVAGVFYLAISVSLNIAIAVIWPLFPLMPFVFIFVSLAAKS